MFGIGMPEMLVILAVALIVVGPDKLPELAKKLAAGLSDLKKTAADLKKSFTEEGGPGQIINDIKPDLEEAARNFQKQLTEGREGMKAALSDVKPPVGTLRDLHDEVQKQEEKERQKKAAINSDLPGNASPETVAETTTAPAAVSPAATSATEEKVES
ncbi:MAG: twin-arginine translocase TatA/TatE family subunit [Desulforhopalus sp.]|nr:twin-arginine translocase TatA/TatE family subunit [Desulforhopalus sp.]